MTTENPTTTKPATVPAPNEITIRPALALVHNDDPITGMLFDTGRFEHLTRVAKMFSESGMVPDAFKRNVAACAVGIALSQRLGVDPFMLFQRLYVISGKPGIEAQLAIAIANQRGVFTGPIQYEFKGDNKDKTRTCRAYAILSKTKTPVEMVIGWDTVTGEGWDKKNGSKWNTMPDQMFRYRTAMWLIRTACPEVLHGMYSAEELADEREINITPAKPMDTATAALATGQDMSFGPTETTPQDAEITQPPTTEKKQADTKPQTAQKPTTKPKASPKPQAAEKPPVVAVKTPEPEKAPAEQTQDAAPATEEQPAAEPEVDLHDREAAEACLLSLIEKSGMNAENKKTSLELMLKSVANSVPRESWTPEEYKSACDLLKSIVERNARIAALKAKQQGEGAK